MMIEAPIGKDTTVEGAAEAGGACMCHPGGGTATTISQAATRAAIKAATKAAEAGGEAETTGAVSDDVRTPHGAQSQAPGGRGVALQPRRCSARVRQR